MFWKIVLLFGLALSVQGETSHAISEQKVVIRHHEPNGGALAHIGKKFEHHEEYAETYPSYEYSYKISDPDTKDVKGQHETRDGNKVNGLYWLLQPNGYKRTVDYVADNGHGFKAKVRYNIQKEHKQIAGNDNVSNNVHENGNKQHKATDEENDNNDEPERIQIIGGNEEIRSNSKAIDSNESNNDSEEKMSPKTNSQSKDAKDLNDEGSNEERVWIPTRNDYVSTQTYGSYEVTESNENDKNENENKGDAEYVKESVTKSSNLRLRESNEKERKQNVPKDSSKTWNVIKLEISHNNNNKVIEHNTSNRHRHGQNTNILNIQNNKKSNPKDTNHAMSENHKPFTNERIILKHSVKTQDRNKPDSYIHAEDIENYQSQEHNGYKSRHRFVKTEHSNKIHKTKENSEHGYEVNESLPKGEALEEDRNQSGKIKEHGIDKNGSHRTSHIREENEYIDSNNRYPKNKNRLHQTDIDNSRSQEENDKKSKNRSGKLENISKTLNSKEKSGTKTKINEDSLRGIATEHGRTKLSKSHTKNYRNKAENFDSLPNQNEVPDARFLIYNRNRENHSTGGGSRQSNNINVEKETFSPINNNKKPHFEQSQNNDNVSEEIFEHHIVVHHPTLNHKNQK